LDQKTKKISGVKRTSINTNKKKHNGLQLIIGCDANSEQNKRPESNMGKELNSFCDDLDAYINHILAT
jgi:hypothetical protein